MSCLLQSSCNQIATDLLSQIFILWVCWFGCFVVRNQWSLKYWARSVISGDTGRQVLYLPLATMANYNWEIWVFLIWILSCIFVKHRECPICLSTNIQYVNIRGVFVFLNSPGFKTTSQHSCYCVLFYSYNCIVFGGRCSVFHHNEAHLPDLSIFDALTPPLFDVKR